MNTKDAKGPLCVAGIAIAVLSIAFVLPFQARDNASARFGGGGSTSSGMMGEDGGSTTMRMGTNGTGAMAGGNESTSQIRMHVQEALSAARSGNLQAVIMHLNLALNALGGSGAGMQGNMTGTMGGHLMSDTTTTSNQ